MSLPQLSIVATQAESPAARALRLMAEARLAAEEQVHALEAALSSVAHLSVEIAEGGDAYPPGVRDLCRRLVDEAVGKAQTLETMLRHASPSPQRR